MSVFDNGTGPYTSVLQLGGSGKYSWMPKKHQDRAAAYEKYDQLYWNDFNQFPIRYLVGEFPMYIPNARTVVDTTAHYYLKGLSIQVQEPEKFAKTDELLKDFLKREMFISRFHTAKHTGVARGDYCFHMTADKTKPAGKRISLTSVHPGKVFLDEDPDDCQRIVGAHLVEQVPHPAREGDVAVRELHYWYEAENDDLDETGVLQAEIATLGEDEEPAERTVMREENIWEVSDWWDSEKRTRIATILEAEALPDEITTIPVYWFTNLGWDDGPYGYSDLRGFERIFQGISQVTTDQGTSLSLEGLGVYATDGGRPVDSQGKETQWEIGPGKVMEVPGGAYFRRVEGVGSVRPNLDHTDYLESKLREAGGLSDVALGRVDVQTATSGIALAIKFMPTLAKLDERDKVGIDRLTQLFYDWQQWYLAYEDVTLDGTIEVTIGDKLPTDRTGRINELNNMLDRGVISKQYYRSEMQSLGYEFPDDIADQIQEEGEEEAKQKALAAPPGLQQNAVDASTGDMPPPPGNQPGQVTQKKIVVNQSNNKGKPNESGGTEAGQDPKKQARGGKPTVSKRNPTAAS